MLSQKNLKRVTMSLLILLVFFLPLSCKENTEKVEEGGIHPPANEEAIILFYTGSVIIQSAGEQREAAIGDILSKNDLIQVGESSSCEIQLGDSAIIYVEEDSIMELSSLYNNENGTDVELDLRQGAVMCKVNRLLGNERFEVKTETTIAGVRGTQFLVRSDDGLTTTLAVKEGTVQLRPSINLSELTESGKEAKVTDFLMGLSEEFPVVGAGEEVTITTGISQQAQESFELMKKILKENQGAEQADALEELKAAGTLLTSFGKTTDISEENRKKLDMLEKSEILLFDNGDAVLPVQVRIEGPKGATLTVNGRFMESSDYNGLQNPDEPVFIGLSMDGFYPLEETVTPRTDQQNNFSFELEKKPDKAYTVLVEPANATIEVNGETMGSSPFNGILEPGQTAEILVNAAGFNPRWSSIEYSEQDETLEVELQRTLITSYKPTNSRITGMNIHGNTLIYSDFDGSLSAVQQSSQKIWTIPTINSEIEASTPEIINGAVAVSGLNELVVANADTGDILFRKTLEAGEQHIFGRHPVAFNNRIIYPNNDGFRILDKDTGESLASVVLSGGTRMTPAVYQNRIYLANQDGDVYIYDINGSQRGSITTQANRPIALGITIDNGFGYFADKEGMLIKVNLSSQTVVWQKRLIRDESVPVSESLVISGSNLFTYSRGVLYGVSKETGEVVFSTGKSYTAPPLVYNDVVYIGGRDKNLYALDSRSGEVLTSVPLNGTVSCRPIYGNGRVYAGTEKGSIFEIRTVEKPLF